MHNIGIGNVMWSSVVSGTAGCIRSFVFGLVLWAAMAGSASAATVVTLTSPVRDSRTAGTVTITASATLPVLLVNFYVDGAPVGVGVAAPYSWSWNSSLWADGDHVIAVKAYDASANLLGIDALVVSTSNPIAITNPADLINEA